MSAELYDAELAGALARPAIDVLPTGPSRKDKASTVLPGVPLAPSDEGATRGDDTAAETVVVESAPIAMTVGAPEVAPTTDESTTARKVFGVSLGRGRRAKPEAAEEGAETFEALPVPTLEPDVTHEDVPAPAAVEPVAEIVPLAPAVADPSEEIRALHALLESTEQLRQQADARAAAVEATARTAANEVQEWQIRHREAEATITELAASLAGAEGRMAELREQVTALEAERDDLVSQLDTATSPSA